MKNILITAIFTSVLFASVPQQEYKINFENKIQQLKKQAKYIEPLQLKSIIENKTMDNLYILDIREANEVEPQGHIKATNYINIPRGLVEFKINKNITNLNSNIVVVCYTELRSLFVQKNLKELGYKNVSVLKGGMQKWNSECLPKNEMSNLFYNSNKKAGCGGIEERENVFKFNRSGI